MAEGIRRHDQQQRQPFDRLRTTPNDARNWRQTLRQAQGGAYTLSYNAENQLVSVTGPSMTATFVYDGGGARVKSTINSTTTYFVGGHYEVTGSQVTKYYFAGSQRIAIRKNGTLSYMLSDHLGSTVATTNTSGQLVSGQLYKAWGEVRYSLGTSPTKYTYTGQYSNVSEFGLMFYNARWYDPVSGRFAQADAIVPAGVQGLDRHAYANNSPMVYVDPTGHFTEDAIKEYLRGYCENEKACYDSILKQWQADTEWWDMITEAQEGDVLFGMSATVQKTFEFSGAGIETLTGIKDSSVTLLELQQGWIKSTRNIYGGSPFKWYGFYRTDERGKPSFYVRPGYELKQYRYDEWLADTADGLFAIPFAVVTIPLSPWVTIPGGFFAGVILPTDIASDAMNMQPQDVNVQIGPIYFNFQLDVVEDEWVPERQR